MIKANALTNNLIEVINDEVRARMRGDDPVCYSEILFALRVAAYIVLMELKEDRRPVLIMEHIKQMANMLGIPLVMVEREDTEPKVLN